MQIARSGSWWCGLAVSVLSYSALVAVGCADGSALSPMTTDGETADEASSSHSASTGTSGAQATSSSGNASSGPSTSSGAVTSQSQGTSTASHSSAAGDPSSTGGSGHASTLPGSGSSGANSTTSDGSDSDTEVGSSADDATSSGTDGDLPVKPSAGCSASGGTPQISNAMVGLPQGYDGKTPSAVIFAFHAAGNPSTQLQGEYGNTVLGQNYVMVYGAASGGTSGWNLQADKSRFNTMFDELLQQVCVDENRIFATGHSSGAQFIVQLLCNGETRFRAVAPVASSSYCNKWDTAVPALVMHGQNDRERGGIQDADGAKDFAAYSSSNGCSGTSMPSDVDVAGCGNSISPNCVQYDGCSEPTIWCQHDDPNYGGTQHGIPCFAEAAMHDFFGRF